MNHFSKPNYMKLRCNGPPRVCTGMPVPPPGRFPRAMLAGNGIAGPEIAASMPRQRVERTSRCGCLARQTANPFSGLCLMGLDSRASYSYSPKQLEAKGPRHHADTALLAFGISTPTLDSLPMWAKVPTTRTFPASLSTIFSSIACTSVGAVQCSWNFLWWASCGQLKWTRCQEALARTR